MVSTAISIILCGSLLTILGDDIFDGNESDEDSAIEAQRLSYLRRSKVEDRKPRQIEPQRNWLAKLFNVKPATKYICFSISKRKALQAIGGILKEWKRYGIRNVQVDKERNIVFARVAARNCKLIHSQELWHTEHC